MLKGTDTDSFALKRRALRVMFLFGLFFGMTAAHAAGVCIAGDLNQLKACAGNLSSYDGISLSAEMECNGTDCCGSNSGAVVSINGLSGKFLEGNGHRIHRTASQRVCPVVAISQSSGITVRNIVLDEALEAPPCTPTDNCSATIDVSGSSSVTLDYVDVRYGKAYVIHAWGVNGFVVQNSSVLDAGIIGIYVGHDDWAPSRKIGIYNSSIIASRTNGIAIESANGDQDGDNAIVGNVIQGNHWHGLWQDSAGGIYPGGQVYLAMANHLIVKDNSIGNGFCDNCVHNTIGGVELGDSGHPNSVRSIQFVNNLIYNQSGPAAYVNAGVAIDGSISFTGNRSVSNGYGLTVPNAALSNNINVPVRVSMDWEQPGSWPAGWSTWQQCSSGAQIVRWCPGSGEAMEGNCALRVMTSTTSCNDGWQGIWTQGAYQKVSPGTTVYLSGWRRNGSLSGKVCLTFQNASGTEIGMTCSEFGPVAQWRYQGIPIVQAVAPAGTVTVAAKFGLTSANGTADLDSFKLAW